jgi:hypothetical protein
MQRSGDELSIARPKSRMHLRHSVLAPVILQQVQYGAARK